MRQVDVRIEAPPLPQRRKQVPWGYGTVYPNAIPSGQKMGTPSILGNIGPTAIASQQAMGTPGVVGPIYPNFIPTPRAIGTPGVVGPIYPSAVPSKQAMGTPNIQAPQTVDPTAIASQQAMGTPTLNFSKTVFPSAVPSKQAMGTPNVVGGPNSLLPRTIPSQQRMGIPSLTGGAGIFQVYISGKLYGGRALWPGASDSGSPVSYASSVPPTIRSQTLGRWSLDIDLYDETGNFVPVFGQSIVIIEANLNLFAGCIQTVITEPLMSTELFITGQPTKCIYHVTATDKSGICDRRFVTGKTYHAVDPVTMVPTTVQSVILDILANYLNGEGITATAQSVPALGNLAADMPLNFVSVTSAFNQLATLSGCIWTVSPLGVLTFNAYANLPAAPFSITRFSNNYRGLIATTSSLNYRNKQYAVSNLTVLPGGIGGGGGSGAGSKTETYTMTAGLVGVLVLADGTTIYGVQTALPIGTLYSITVNGHPQTVVSYSAWAGQQPVFGTNDFGPWFWLSGSNQVALSVLSGAAFPIAGSTLVINYTPFTTSVAAAPAAALDPIDPVSGDPVNGCGSGVYEAVVQVQNISSVDSLNAIAKAELAKSGGIPINVSFQTDQSGLQPGQLLTVDRPDININNKVFLITAVQGVYSGGPLAFGSGFQWKVEAQTNEDPGNFAQWYATLVQMASNPLPVPQYEVAEFVLAPGSSLAGTTVTTNPVIVKRSGLLFDMYVAAATPPIQQNLRITFNVNGNPLGVEVILPAGAVPNQVYRASFPIANPVYVAASATGNDVITINATYVVTGGSPVPASNVTASLRWTM